MKKVKILSLSFMGAFWLFPSIYFTFYSAGYGEYEQIVTWRQYLAEIILYIRQIIITEPIHIPPFYYAYIVTALAAIVFLGLSLAMFKKKRLHDMFYGISIFLTLVALISDTIGLVGLISITNSWGKLMLIIPHLFFIASTVLFVIYLFRRYSFHRRPTKVQQLEARVAELEKQISDNDKGE